MNGITTVESALAWAALKEAVWKAVNDELGQVPNLRVLANMHKDQIMQAMNAAIVPVDGTADTRDLLLVEISQVGSSRESPGKSLVCQVQTQWR